MTSGDPDTAVLVVGAGPTGLLLAVELRRRGVDCVLVDAYDEPLGWDRATVVHPRSLQILESLGVVDELLTAGVHIRASRVYSDGALLASPDRRDNRTRYPFDIGLSEETTERVLTDVLVAHGGAVTRSTRLVRLRQDDDQATATVETGGRRREISARWVVGCDGYRSAVREAAGIAYEERAPDSAWAVFDAGLEGWTDDWDLTVAYLDDPLVILTPLPGRRFRVYTRPESRGADLRASTLAVVHRYAPGVAFTDVRNPTHFLCHSRVADRFRVGRVLLAGDAAHACSPAEGHGMNTGLQDAHNLGWKLALESQARAGRLLLDSYEAERRPVAERIVDSGAASDAAQSRLDEPTRTARNAALAAVFDDPDAAHLEAAAEAEVDRDYTGSPVVVGGGAGRLLPITEDVHPVDGPPVPLHELAHRLGHTVFVVGGPTTAPAEVAAVVEALAAVRTAGLVDATYGFVVDGDGDAAPLGVGTMAPATAALLGVSTLTLLVVRPDRYVGLRWEPDADDTAVADPADASASLVAYLTRLGG